MKRYQSLWLALAAAGAVSAAGCGDDSKACGPGTTDVDGVCTADNTTPTVTCTDGTELNSTNDGCVVSDAVCQAGTVLINSECVDPTDGLTVDTNEGAEPNGFGIQGEESSTAVAGEIAVKPVGMTTVVKGVINPFRDASGDGENDADFDTYRITATGPTLLEVSADGTNGISASFFVESEDAVDELDPLFGFQRYGISLRNDTAKRFLYLPEAGNYLLAVADIRSMYIGNTPPNPAGIAGAAGSANSAYYLSLTARDIPAPTPVTFTDNVANRTGTFIEGGPPAFFSVPMGAGLNRSQVDIGGVMVATVVASEGSSVRANSTESNSFFGSTPAATLLIAGQTATYVADYIWNSTETEVDFVVQFTTSGAGALSTTGGTAEQPEDADELTTFTYDVAAADEIKGFDLVFDQAVSGVIVDKDLFIVGSLGTNASGSFATTFTTFRGHIRHRAAGKYYVIVFDATDDDDAETTLTATSTITTVTPTTLTKGTPLAAEAVTPFRQNIYSYAAGVATDAWQQFTASGTGTGTITARFYDPATAYGQLDTVTAITGTPVTNVPAAALKFTRTFASAGATSGRILLDDGVDRYLVTVDTALTPTPAATFNLDFRRKNYTDLATINNGATVTRAGEQLAVGDQNRFYLYRNQANAVSNVTVTPEALLNTRILRHDTNEAVTGTFNTGAVGGVDTAQIINTAAGWIALSVSSTTPVVSTQTFDLTIANALFAPRQYTRTVSAQVFDDCVGAAGSTDIFLTGTDEGFSTSLTSGPVGFDYFGYAVGSFSVSSNGWLTFGAPGTVPLFTNTSLPSTTAPNGIIAPYWDDLDFVDVCTRVVGTTRVVQWDGIQFDTGEDIQFQVIFDGSDDTIRFLYGPDHAETGVNGTVGIEDQAGTTGNLVGFNMANTTLASTGYLYTPIP